MNNTYRKYFQQVVVVCFSLFYIQLGYGMDLLISTGAGDHSLFQSALEQETEDRWQLSEYVGTDLALVEEIRQRAVVSDLPNAAQIPGATIQRWAALGFVSDIESVSVAGSWNLKLPNKISEFISYRGKTYAVPTQIHRSNWMWMNSARLGDGKINDLTPRTWKAFFELAERKKRLRQPFMLLVDDPAQNTLILEALILGLKGADFYQQVFEELNYKALRSQDMVDVFQRFSEIRSYMNGDKYEDWESASKALASGKGTLMFAGDWVKPFFLTEDGSLPDSVLCEPLPEAAATFLFNLSSVVLFKQTDHEDSLELAQSLFTQSMLTEMNIREGSIPARLDISPWGFDRCSVRAMREFRSAHTIETLQPSLATGMAANEIVQQQVYEAVNAFISTPEMSPEIGALKLAKAIRVAVLKI